jgi:hypothetical protein
VSGRRKPRVVGTGQDINVVETPPPGPPRYELVNAWPPSKPPRKALRSRVPIISTALAAVIAMLILIPHLLPQQPSPIASTTTVTSTRISATTISEVKTLTVTITTTSTVDQNYYNAWLKIVTDSWDGATIGGFPTPVWPVGPGFADRYNATNVCVELYWFRNPHRHGPEEYGFTDFERRFAGSPNATGFIRISWPQSWANLTIIVKAKSYHGECIGTENEKPFEGIIVYWLTINPTNTFRRKFSVALTGNRTIGDDGIEVSASTSAYFDWDVNAPFGAGPVDIVTPKNTATWGADFQKDHDDPYARNAWVARAAYIFMLFHEHTWYSIKDNLTYATIFIYDMDHTSADSTKSLLQAAITGLDGQSRYTREITGSGKFADNNLVPIPLQTINLGQKRPFKGGIPDPAHTGGNIEAPHLNATKRVWWETVLTNQTFYVGNEYNGTGRYSTDQNMGITRPLFGAFPANPSANPTTTRGGISGVPAGPLSLALNHTVPTVLNWVNGIVNNVASFGNNTVFYSRICVQLNKQGGGVASGAEIMLKSITSSNITDYPLHGRYITGNDGCTKKDSSKWPGYMDKYENYIRFPNGTDWSGRGSLNASYFFIPINDISPAWGTDGYFMRASDANWAIPYNNANKNYSALIPKITYMMTRTLTDDPRWGGIEIQIKLNEQQSDRKRITNPYILAVASPNWVVRKDTPEQIEGEEKHILIIINP